MLWSSWFCSLFLGLVGMKLYFEMILALAEVKW